MGQLSRQLWALERHTMRNSLCTRYNYSNWTSHKLQCADHISCLTWDRTCRIIQLPIYISLRACHPYAPLLYPRTTSRFCCNSVEFTFSLRYYWNWLSVVYQWVLDFSRFFSRGGPSSEPKQKFSTRDSWVGVTLGGLLIILGNHTPLVSVTGRVQELSVSCSFISGEHCQHQFDDGRQTCLDEWLVL